MALKSKQGDFKKTVNPTKYDEKYIRLKPGKDILRRQKLRNLPCKMQTCSTVMKTLN
jgi:hypothetical protein